MIENESIIEMIELLKTMPHVVSKLYFERLLPQFTLNEQLWMLYIECTLRQCKD